MKDYLNILKNDTYINSILLLVVTFFSICIAYYYLFDLNEIITILKEEYILSSFVALSFIILLYSYLKLKKYDILPFIPKLGKVPIKQSIVFFSIFEIIDYYSEDGIIGAIKLWYMYWLFGILSLNLMYIFNYYKNFKFYKLKF
jgi:hypothetical protein